MSLFSRREMKKTKIEIIPMIDTMFFLLVFFILASLNVIDVKGAQVDLPDSRNQDPQAPASLTVTIKQNGEVGINNRLTVTDPNEDIGPKLLTVLQEEMKDKGSVVVDPDNAVVIINADRRATAAMIRRCFDDARRSSFRRFSIATEPRTYAE